MAIIVKHLVFAKIDDLFFLFLVRIFMIYVKTNV